LVFGLQEDLLGSFIGLFNAIPSDLILSHDGSLVPLVGGILLGEFFVLLLGLVLVYLLNHCVQPQLVNDDLEPAGRLFQQNFVLEARTPREAGTHTVLLNDIVLGQVTSQ